MNLVHLGPLQLTLGAGLVLAVGLLTLWMQLGLFWQLTVAALRTTVQLLLIGLVLKVLFAAAQPLWLAAMGLVMLLVAAREVRQRQKRAFAGWWGFGLGAFAMLASSFSITLFALAGILRLEPWYLPQYAIPFLGMMLGNTMNGISLGLDQLTHTCWQQQRVIEARLMLGQTWRQAVEDARRESVRSGLIPIVNAMSIAGLVSLPGMMTGQILAGSPPQEAVKYQILIMFMIAGGTGLGTVTAVWIGARRLFDERQRLRLDRLRRTR